MYTRLHPWPKATIILERCKFEEGPCDIDFDEIVIMALKVSVL